MLKNHQTVTIKMRTKLRNYILSVLFAYLGIISASGQQPSDSLIYYLEIAARNNPELLRKYNEYQAALQKIPQVGSLPDPELSMGMFLSPMELLSGKQVADIRLMQMFPWFGVLKNARDEMSLMAKAKYESFRDSKAQVFYDVQRTWYELQKNYQSIRIAEKNLEILRMIERLSINKFKVSSATVMGTANGTNMQSGTAPNNNSGTGGMSNMGGNTGSNQSSMANAQTSSMQQGSMVSMSGSSDLADLYRIQIETGDLINNITFLKTRQKTIIARFNSYLNRQAISPVALPDTIKKDSIDVSLLVLSDSLILKHPMLGMLQYEKQSFDAKKRMISRMGYPMAGIGLNYSVIKRSDMSVSEMNGKDMIMPMLSVTIPVYRKKYKAMQEEADLMKTAIEYGYMAASNSLQTEYYDALQLYQDAERRMKLYSDQHFLAEKSLNIMIKSFSASGIELTDLLRIRQQLLDYQLRQIEAITDYNTAIAWIKRLMSSYVTQEN